MHFPKKSNLWKISLRPSVRVMARVMASEPSSRGIRINVVSPGSVDTSIWDAVASTPEEKEALYQNVARGIPSGAPLGAPIYFNKLNGDTAKGD